MLKFEQKLPFQCIQNRGIYLRTILEQSEHQFINFVYT